MTDEHTPADDVTPEPVVIADDSDLVVDEPASRRRFAALRSAHAVAALGILLAGIGILAMGVAPLIDHGGHHGDRPGDRQGQQMQDDDGGMRGPGGPGGPGDAGR
jgi:hypothetical protein